MFIETRVPHKDTAPEEPNVYRKPKCHTKTQLRRSETCMRGLRFRSYGAANSLDVVVYKHLVPPGLKAGDTNQS